MQKARLESKCCAGAMPHIRFHNYEGEAVALFRVSEQWAGVARAVPVFWPCHRTGEETGEDFDPRARKSPSKKHLKLEARVGIVCLTDNSMPETASVSKEMRAQKANDSKVILVARTLLSWSLLLARASLVY